MNFVLLIVYSIFPLLLITVGALCSEYAGRMACFLDGIINLGAFLCFAFTVLTKNALTGCILSVIVCTLSVYFLEKLITRLSADIFLCSLAMNILFTALCSFLSSVFFNTRNVLSSEYFSFNPVTMRPVTAVVCLAVTGILLYFLFYTKDGLCLRISGSDSNVLEAKGISFSEYKNLSWCITALCGALCGCCLCLRLSSFVPSISAGRGWIALAIVFLGHKKPVLIAVSAVVFSFADVCSSYVQNISFLKSVPSSVLLALPYILCLVMILFIPDKSKSK